MNTYTIPLSIIRGLDGKSTGAISLFTNDTGRDLYLVDIRAVGNSISGLVTPPTLSIGTNGATYNNIISATALPAAISGANLTQSILNPLSFGTGQKILNGVEVFVNHTVGATATTYLYDLLLILVSI